uniref:Uncharacterized protein n=1 Tax=viral metagenome TaxID=1070528 RepID=A0A6H1ZIB8_9ZZZZ
MKPTQEIINLARQLHGLGVDKELEVGDRYFFGKYPDESYILWGGSYCDMSGEYIPNAIVIPPLEWCLEWFRENGWTWYLMIADEDDDDDGIKKGECGISVWNNNIHATDTMMSFINKSPYLAVLKAMVEVKTAE